MAVLARAIEAVLGYDAAGEGGGEVDGSGCAAWWEVGGIFRARGSVFGGGGLGRLFLVACCLCIGRTILGSW